MNEFINNLFIPDISFCWNEGFKVYLVTAKNEIGHLFLKRISGIRYAKGKIVPLSLIEEYYNSALRLGLCCERIDKE
jgi:hypothetical protein